MLGVPHLVKSHRLRKQLGTYFSAHLAKFLGKTEIQLDWMI